MIEEPNDYSRRKLCTMVGGVAATFLVGSLVPAGASQIVSSVSAMQAPRDADVLNFALNLEYLEAEFYSVVTTGTYLSGGDTTGTGDQGATRGGKRIQFQNSELTNLAAELYQDEIEHVRFLRAALGDAAVSKPEINLDALGIGFANDQEFLTLARAFEDVGASAYRAAAMLLHDKNLLDAAAGILATEAYHAGNLRAHIVYSNMSVPALDAHDQPPTAKNFFPTDHHGLAIGRQVDQVGDIVRGKNPEGGAFYPRGLNGKIR